MMREFVQLAKTYQGQWIAGRFASEKLDGQRCLWDGGITRGLPLEEVPFCNVAKMERFIEEPIATGLWSRYGKPIIAPNDWLDQLPTIALDGELWAGRGKFQQVTSTTRTLKPDPEKWQQIQYKVYGLPPYRYWLMDGQISNPHMNMFFKDIHRWAYSRAKDLGIRAIETPQNWLNSQKILKQYSNNEVFQLVEHRKLSGCQSSAVTDVHLFMRDMLALGAEGLILSDPTSFWLPERSDAWLKVKDALDAEAEVVGYTWGRETDKGSKFKGMMGCLLVNYGGKEFGIHGFTDEERELVGGEVNSGERAVGAENPMFPVGSTITFRYRELTDDGIPKEARYLRKAEPC